MNATQAKILDVAGRLTQTKGFGGFSYLDIAEEIGIKSSSIHYYFKNKDDLAVALVEDVHLAHEAAMQKMSMEMDTPQARLEAIIDFFKGYIVEDKFCLCGMMSAELQSLSANVRARLIAYFDAFQAWLEEQFVTMSKKDPRNQALRFISLLEGSLLLARLNRDPELVHQALAAYSTG